MPDKLLMGLLVLNIWILKRTSIALTISGFDRCGPV